jgi:hypothetical protein
LPCTRGPCTASRCSRPCRPAAWDAVAGDAGHSALGSRSPGTEGADGHFAALLSQRTPGRAVYALWFDPERRQAVEWKEGRAAGRAPEGPAALARRLGSGVAAQALRARSGASAAVAEGADGFEVLVLRGGRELGSLRLPPLAGSEHGLAAIKGETTPAAIVRVLGIPAGALSLSDEPTR